MFNLKKDIVEIMVEILLYSGVRTLLPKNWNKVYNIKEFKPYRLYFIGQFPFIRWFNTPVTRFTFRTVYEYMGSFLDPTYYAKCSCIQLAKMFEIDVQPFDSTIVNDDMTGDAL